MTNPKYGAIKTNVVPKKNTGLYFGFIVRQYKGFRQVIGNELAINLDYAQNPSLTGEQTAQACDMA